MEVFQIADFEVRIASLLGHPRRRTISECQKKVGRGKEEVQSGIEAIGLCCVHRLNHNLEKKLFIVLYSNFFVECSVSTVDLIENERLQYPPSFRPEP
jgi:hypothetical protein